MSSSTSPSKKRKHRADDDLERRVKKKEKRDKESKKKDKGKSREDASEFCVIKASLVVSVPPVFATNLRGGVEEMLDSMIMRYIPAFQGVVLAHSNLRFLSTTAKIKGDCPFSICTVAFDATVWSPRISMKLVGRVNLYSPDHVSLLVHRTFNVSIPRHHIPEDQWVFEYGPAENDPEFGAAAEGEPYMSEDKEDEVQKDVDQVSQHSTPESGGQWVHKITGEKLGGPERYLEFTVIGLTVANEMLSLQGSIQPDPFSPEHVVIPSIRSPPPVSDNLTLVANQDEMDASYENMQEEEEEEEGYDAFERLGRIGDEKARELKRRGEQKEKQKEQDIAREKNGKRKAAGDTNAMEVDQKKPKKAKRRKDISL